MSWPAFLFLGVLIGVGCTLLWMYLVGSFPGKPVEDSAPPASPSCTWTPKERDFVQRLFLPVVKDLAAAAGVDDAGEGANSLEEAAGEIVRRVEPLFTFEEVLTGLLVSNPDEADAAGPFYNSLNEAIHTSTVEVLATRLS